jgi:putative phosphoesterase
MTSHFDNRTDYPANPPLTIGIVSDTHIPDRARELHPTLLPSLKAFNVDLILHAGDLSATSVLSSLEAIAPVIACRGNRDLLLSHLPWQQNLCLANIQFSLLHGHGNLRQYIQDKFFYALQGYRFERYQKILLSTVPEAQVIVFGHTHRSVNIWQNGILFFNPGSTSITVKGETLPSFGVIKISADSEIHSEIIPLKGVRLKSSNWIPDSTQDLSPVGKSFRH